MDALPSPLPFATLLWEAAPGEWCLTLTVRVTFRMRHGEEAAMVEVPPPGARPGGSDDVPLKAKTDVLVVGDAHAPSGTDVESLHVRARVGDVERRLLVTGDRTWAKGEKGMVPGPPGRFSFIPLRPERALRTRDNPAGVDPGAAPREGAAALANLEAEDGGAAWMGPVPFGAIADALGLGAEACSWAEAFSRGSAPAVPPPAGFDFRAFNAAPSGQCVDLFRGGAVIELENLVPDHPHFESRLPAGRPRAYRVDGRGGRPEEIALRCDTVVVDARTCTAALTWRGVAALRSRADAAAREVVVVWEAPGTRIRPEQIALAGDADSGRGALVDGGSWGGDEREDPLDVRHDAIKTHGEAARSGGESDHAHVSSTDRRVDAPGSGPIAVLGVSALRGGTARTPEDSVPEDGENDDPTADDPRDSSPPSSEPWDPTTTERNVPEPPITMGPHAAPNPGAAPAPPTGRAVGPGKKPIGLREYARLVIAIERADVGAVLAELDLELGDVVRIQRVWTERMKSDPALAAAIRRVLETERNR